MKALRASLSFATFILAVSCDTGSATSTSALTVSTTSQFDVMVTDYLKADGSALQDDREAIALNANKAAVAEAVTLDVWLKDGSANYSTYFKSDGSMQEKTPGTPYIAKWYVYEEGNLGKVFAPFQLQIRADRLELVFPDDSFADGSKRAILLLRIYEPGTIDMGVDKEGVQDWQILFSKTVQTLDLSGIKIQLLNVADANAIADAASNTLNYKSALSGFISVSNEASLTTEGTADKANVTMKNFQLTGAGSAELFISQLTGIAGTSDYVVTSVNPALNKNEINVTPTPYTDNVRADFFVQAGKKGRLLVSISDKKYALVQDVALELLNK